MTEDTTADLQGSSQLLIAFMDEHEEFAHVCEAAMGLAKRSGARIILYDRDAASSWGDPLPTWWSAAGERGQAIPEESQSTRMARWRPGYRRRRDGVAG